MPCSSDYFCGELEISALNTVSPPLTMRLQTRASQQKHGETVVGPTSPDQHHVMRALATRCHGPTSAPHKIVRRVRRREKPM
jgi:hypothetical protein